MTPHTVQYKDYKNGDVTTDGTWSRCDCSGKGGWVWSASIPVQKQPQPVGHIGTFRVFQQEMWVTWKHRRQFLESPGMKMSGVDDAP